MNSYPPPLASYEVVFEEHRELLALISTIEQALVERTATIAEVTELVKQLGHRLGKHFALEEQGGYFSDAMMHAPQLIAKARQLLEQHPLICVQAGQLLLEIQGIPATQDWWEAACRRFLTFRDEILRHERLEDRLIQEAYGQDLGSHD